MAFACISTNSFTHQTEWRTSMKIEIEENDKGEFVVYINDELENVGPFLTFTGARAYAAQRLMEMTEGDYIESFGFGRN